LERIYGLDALRALTMYLGVILHSSIAYKAGHHPRYWISDHDAKSYFFDVLYFWIHSFRMPLFFLLSGFFTVLLYRKIGSIEFIKNRFKRIGVPLLVCVIVLLPISVAPFTFSRLYLDQGRPAEEVWNQIFSEMKRLALFQEFKGLQHFWFLLNLLYFYIAFIFLSKIGFKFERFRVPQFKSSVWLVVVCGLNTLLILLLYWNDLTPSIWTGLFPKNPQLIYYGFFYGLGIFIYFNKEWLLRFKDKYVLFLSIGTIISLLNVYMVNNLLEEGAFTVLVLVYKFLYALQNVLLSFGLIGFCLRHLNFSSSRIRYFSDASYWVYIIHLVLVASIQILCIVYNVYPPLRFVTTLLGTTLLAYLTYHFFIRYSFIGTALHGARFKETLKSEMQ
jgi:glucan biosynthesis protein C